MEKNLVGGQFANQRFADSRESIRTKKKPIFEALGQIRANRVFSPIRIQIRGVILVQSSLLSIFWKANSQKKGFFSFSSENRFARIGPLRTRRKRGTKTNKQNISLKKNTTLPQTDKNPGKPTGQRGRQAEQAWTAQASKQTSSKQTDETTSPPAASQKPPASK